MTSFMGCSAVKVRRIHDWMLRAALRVVDYVLDTLELWYIWGSSVNKHIVNGAHDVRAVILHNMYNFANMST